jgi:hypothetical protein
MIALASVIRFQIVRFGVYRGGASQLQFNFGGLSQKMSIFEYSDSK